MQALFDIFSGFFRIFSCAGQKSDSRLPEIRAAMKRFSAGGPLAPLSRSHVWPGHSKHPASLGADGEPAAFRRAPGKHEALKNSRVLREDPGRKYRIELSPNYFLYLIAVPISLTVTVLIPQMQFIL